MRVSAPVAPLGHHALLLFLLQVGMLLGLAYPLGRVAGRFAHARRRRLNFLAGVVLGPSRFPDQARRLGLPDGERTVFIGVFARGATAGRVLSTGG